MVQRNNKAYIILHDIRSAANVGSIFRTADGAGVSKIYVTGYTPAPVDRFGRARGDIVKVALGAEKSVPWEQGHTITACIKRLQKEGVQVVAVEQAPGARDYKSYRPHFPAAFVFGNEVRGLSNAVRKASDLTIEIPMHGSKESLNVSVAAGIVLFAALVA